MPSFDSPGPMLLSLLSLLSRAPAVALTHQALARRRLKKSSIYLSWKWPVAAVAEGSIATATPSDNSDDSDNRPEPAGFVSLAVLNTSSIWRRTNQA